MYKITEERLLEAGFYRYESPRKRKDTVKKIVARLRPLEDLAAKCRTTIEVPSREEFLNINDLNVTHGPQGHWLDLKRRIIYLDVRCYEDVWTPRWILHEIAHAYTGPPGFSIFDFPEDLLLMQWERSVARHFLPQDYDSILELQEETVSGFFAPEIEVTLGECRTDFLFDYQRSKWWRAGFKLLRKLGGLTPNGRPTFSPLAWERIPTKALRRISKKHDRWVALSTEYLDFIQQL